MTELDRRRDRLRRYATWTPDDLAEFTEALRAQRVVEERAETGETHDSESASPHISDEAELRHQYPLDE